MFRFPTRPACIQRTLQSKPGSVSTRWIHPGRAARLRAISTCLQAKQPQRQLEGFDLRKTRVSGGDVFTLVVSSAAGQSAQATSSTSISPGVWYHVAAVRGSNFLQLYVNGQLQGQGSVSFPQDYGNLPLYFGTSGQTYWIISSPAHWTRFPCIAALFRPAK